MSSIVTFYSYKGGVGRSMALANIAVLLARRGLKVLVVDWDLEAPGLERYFSYFSISGKGTGLLQLLLSARKNGSAPFDKFTLSVDCDARHPITFLASGRETDDSYSANLETFDWTEFFSNGGGPFFELLREQWRDQFDIVLIDSRTGLSDTGGICTIQLPDAVVAMFTANNQSLYGVRDVMRLAQNARQALAYDRMPLSILPLPSRWGTQEFQETQIWLDRVVESIQEFYADWLPTSISPRMVAEKIKIPHHSYFGFGERLAVVEQGIVDPTGLGYVYDKIAAFLASDFRDLSALIGADAEPSFASYSPAVRKGTPADSDYNFDVFVSYDRASTDAVIEIVDAIRRELLAVGLERTNLFMDTSEIRAGTQFAEQINQAIDRSRIMLALLTPQYLRSKFCLRELDRFGQSTDHAKRLIPVVLSGSSHELTSRFRTTLLVDTRKSSMLTQAKMSPGRRSSSWIHGIEMITNAVVGALQKS